MSEKTLDNFKVIQTLGQGSWGKVKLVQSDDLFYAAKIFKNPESRPAEILSKYFFNELENSRNMAHPHILKVFNCRSDGIYTTHQGSQVVAYVLMEFCPKGNIYELIGEFGCIPEPVSRLYFKQILDAIETCHLRGFCHRDIKPENILINSEDNAILADLGFSCSTLGRNGNGMLRTPVGTLCFQAPEILLRKPYKGEEIDIFALGVTLFSILTARRPFNKAHVTDPLFNLFTKKNSDYWRAINKHIPSEILTESFMELMNGMLKESPSERWKISDIKSSEWYNKQTGLPIKRVFNQLQTQKIANQIKKTVLRGYRDEVGEIVVSIFNEDFIIPNITLEDFSLLKYSKIITCLEPNNLINSVQILFKKYQIDFPPYNEDLKLRFFSEDLDIDIKFKFFKLEGRLVLFLYKVSGHEFEFLEIFEDLLGIVEILEEDLRENS